MLTETAKIEAVSLFASVKLATPYFGVAFFLPEFSPTGLTAYFPQEVRAA